MSNPAVLAAIRDLLMRENAHFREVHHAPAGKSADVAVARGEELRFGGKALLIKVDDTFRLFVLPGSAKLDSGAIRAHFGTRDTRFATPEELMEKTGLVPGTVPPFGEPILPFELFVDEQIPKNERIAFNAGTLTDSIILPVEDWLRIAKPTVLKYALEG